MSNEIVVNLDSVEKWRNKQEFTVVPRASCTYNGNYYEHISYGEVVKPLLLAMSNAEGHISGQVRVERGGTTCFHPAPIESWLNPVKVYVNDGVRQYWESKGENK